MHGRIIQISTTPIQEDDYISMGKDITSGDFVIIDSIYNCNYTMATAERRKEFLEVLLSLLPEGMFTVDDNGEAITYQGGFELWQQDYLASIRERAEDINADNVMKFGGAVYRLQDTLANPLATCYLFVAETDGKGNGIADRSREFMEKVSGLKKGDKLYIGGILGYHF